MITALALSLLTGPSAPASSSGEAPAATVKASMGSAWSQWRGPGRDGQYHGNPWPEGLDAGRLQLAWRAENLGPSYSGPIVNGSRVFTTATLDEERELVVALDLESGATLWKAGWEGSLSVPFFARRNGSWIRSTPACDGPSVYVAGMRDVLVCLDAATGERRWSVDFVEELGTSTPDFGFVSSPLVEGEHVYVQAGGSVVQLDRVTGAILWRGLVGRGGMSSPFSSPVLARIAGEEQLLVQTREELVGVSPWGGATLWAVPIRSFRGMNILTPLVVGDAVFTAAYGGRAQRIEISGGKNGLEAVRAWDVASQGYMTSPILVDGHVYYLTRGNRFTCLDVETGEVRWTSPPTGDEYWSLVAQDDRILALANTGRLYLLAASPEAYDVLDEAEVASEESWAHLAVVDGHLLVRSQSALAAFAWR